MGNDKDLAPRGETISLKSHHGKYVVADRFHDKWMKADREEADDWESFKAVEQDDHTVALQTFGTDYVACEPDGDMRADRTKVAEWEKFIWIDNSDGTFSLLCGHTGKYLKATPDGVLKADAHLIEENEDCSLHGGAHDCSETKCCKDPHRVCFEKNEHYATCLEGCVEGVHHDDPEEHQTPWSCKPLSPLSDDVTAPPVGKKIALKTAHEKYVAAHPNGLMEADREHRDDWEIFKVHQADDHKIALETAHGKYVACEQHHTVKADRDAINAWEMFGWVHNDDGTISLLCHTGRFWNAPPSGELKSEATFVGSWEEFTVEVI